MSQSKMLHIGIFACCMGLTLWAAICLTLEVSTYSGIKSNRRAKRQLTMPIRIPAAEAEAEAEDILVVVAAADIMAAAAVADIMAVAAVADIMAVAAVDIMAVGEDIMVVAVGVMAAADIMAAAAHVMAAVAHVTAVERRAARIIRTMATACITRFGGVPSIEMTIS